jgi:ribokinase
MSNPTADAAPTAGVVVLGSVNLDQFYRVQALPRRGETVASQERSEGLGGKGANQAVAAARAGAAVTFLGACGDDAAGDWLRASLTSADVDTSQLGTIADAPSGSAVIVVDQGGENIIVVSGGANRLVSSEYVRSVEAVITRAKVLVVQGEIPATASAEAVRIARAAGVRVVVNLAPLIELGAGGLEAADPLVVNEVEASQLLGATIDGVEAAGRAGSRLLNLCVSAVITLGSAGSVLLTAEHVRHIAAPRPARVIDTTGAGDAFVGVLSAVLAAGAALDHAVVAAVAAATLSVQTVGAAESFPDFRGVTGL